MDILTKHTTANNPILKIVIGALFIIFPIIGFILGIQFGYLITKPKVIYEAQEKIIYQQLEDNERRLIKRCGNYPNLIEMPDQKWERVGSSISWSPNCKYLAWTNNEVTFCENGPGDIDNCSRISSAPTNGIYIYDSCSKIAKRVLSSLKQDDDPIFLKWIDSNTIQYSDRKETYKKEYKISF